MKTPLRIERWWWLGVCLVVSLLIHLLIGWNSRTLFGDSGPGPTPGIEVALEPLPVEKKPKPAPKTPEPKPKKLAEKKPSRKPTQIAKAPRPVKTPAHHAPVPRPVRMAKLPVPRPPTKQIVQGGIDPLKQQKPVPLAPIKPTLLKPTKITTATTTPKTIPTHTATAETLPNQTRPVQMAAIQPKMRSHSAMLPMDNPLTNPGTTNEKVTLPATQPNAMRVTRMAKNFSLAGGGLAAPSQTMSGHGGARGPEAPPEDVLFSGGGAGGMKLPKAAPRMGGGGGNPLLTVNNPLSAFAIPEDKPGLGSGLGGGAGTGAKGGVGVGHGRGIGLGLNGKMMASLHRAPGSGIDAGRGSGMGTRPPGGGHGTGSELPGTGGLGGGLGQGLGNGIGSGFRPGLGAAGGAARQGSGGGGGVQVASGGVPFGDISGLLNGNRNGGGGIGGGPGGSGLGAGAGGPGGARGPRRFVYLLDVSGSMAKHDKIGKAREALKKALSELAPGELFNIICFDADRYPFADKMQRVTSANVRRAIEYIDNIKLDQNPGTNFSGVLATALSLSNVSRIFLMSDGDPDNQHETEPDKKGITDFEQLRQAVRKDNAHKVPIDSIALGVGHHFKGMDLMRAIAEDNGGVFRSVNLRDNPVVEEAPK